MTTEEKLRVSVAIAEKYKCADKRFLAAALKKAREQLDNPRLNLDRAHISKSIWGGNPWIEELLSVEREFAPGSEVQQAFESARKLADSIMEHLFAAVEREFGP